MVWRWLLLALLAAAAVAAPTEEAKKKVRYDDFRVYRVVPTTQAQLDFLKELEELDDGVSFWTRPVLDRPVDVMLSPARRAGVLGRSGALGLEASVFIEDVQKLIDEENPSMPFADELDWTAYYPLDSVNEWLLSLPGKYPDAELLNLGKTFEDRDIYGIIIGNRSENKPIVVVESGIHAREWITVASTTYLVNELLTSEDPQIRNVAESFEWHIIPTINPDGYQYSHDYNRLWRKTRSTGENGCNGVDGNRNWNYTFNDDSGSSNNPCSETYRGESPLSEPETAALAQHLEDLGDLLVYFCVHSYSQVLMIPYGLPGGDWSENWGTINIIGQGAIAALANVHGTSYKFGQIYDAIGYSASGGSMDWVKAELGVKYTYEWELRDTGRYGFLLPSNQIVPTAEETLASMVYILEQVKMYEGLSLRGADNGGF